jgi:PAS domain S-box-containing protein
MIKRQGFHPNIYAVAVLSALIATALTLLLQSVLSPTILPLYFVAAAFSSWYGGFKPGMVAVTLSAAAINYYFIPPLYAFTIANWGEVIRIGSFVLVAMLISYLNKNLQHAKQRVEQIGERQLQARDEQLRQALAAACMGLWDWNILTGEIIWSPEHERLFGVTPGTFDGRYETFDTRLHPEDRAGLHQAVQTALQDHLMYQHEYRIVWTDGSVHWMEGRGQAFYNEINQPVRMTGTIMDITARKQAEESLRLSEERYRSLVEATANSVWVIDADGHTMSVASDWTETTGQVPKIGAAWDWLEAIHPDDRERVRQTLSHCLATGKLYEIEYHILAKNGECREVLVKGAPVYNDDGSIREWVGTLNDITEQQVALREREQAEVALRLSEQRYASLAATAPVGIFRTFADGNCIYVNDRWCEMAGFAAEEALGMGWIKALHPDDRNQVAAAWYQAAQTQTMFQMEYRFQRPDGLVIWVYGQASAERTLDGQITGYVGTITDITDRKQIEAALSDLNAELEQRVAERTAELQQAAQEIEDLYNRAPCGYHSLDQEGRFVRINQTELQWLGYEAAEVLGKKFTDFTTPEGVLQFQKNFPKFKKQGWIHDLEYNLRCRDGSLLPVSISVTAINDADGNLIMTRTSLFDLRERKRIEAERNQAELALRESEARYRQIVEVANEGIWEIDANGNTTFVNPKMAKMLGYGVEEMLGRSLFDFLNKEGRAVAIADLERRQGVARQHDFKFQRKDGSDLWAILSSTPITNQQGQFTGTLAMVTDISERRRTEAVLQENARRWQSLLNNVQLAVVGLDQNGNVEYANSFFLKLTGYTEAEVLNQSWFENFIPANLRLDIKKTFQEVLEHNFHDHYQNAILTKSGEERMIAWNNTLLRDLQGYPIGTISIGEDITDRHQLEQMKAEFISVVSHELRTPLTSISGALELLATGLLQPDSDRGQQTIQIAYTEADRLTRLVNDILDLERLESGKVRLEKHPCNLEDLMIRAVDLMQLSADQSNITLSVEPLSVLLDVDGDRILQVLTNLLGNAIKFSLAGSMIWLTAEMKDGQIEGQGNGGNGESKFPISSPYASTPASSYLLITVRDQGRGIPTHKLESIFERFQQVDASDSRQKGGTGLGLAICRNIVQQHGGQIWAESMLGEGSCFYFTLPLSRCQ